MRQRLQIIFQKICFLKLAAEISKTKTLSKNYYLDLRKLACNNDAVDQDVIDFWNSHI